MKKTIGVVLSFLFLISIYGCSSAKQDKADDAFKDYDFDDATSVYASDEKERESILEEEESKEAEPKLSEECDYILCSGYDDDDYYELVANLTEDYPKSTYQVGVIKNNEWLVPLSEKSPFIDKNGRWKGSPEYEKNIVSEKNFEYFSEGCFYYDGYSGVDCGIVYKPETGKWFETANLKHLYHDGDVNYDELEYDSIINKGKLIAQLINDYGLYLLDLNTGNKKEIKGFFEKYDNPDRAYCLSEGLFFAEVDVVLDKVHLGFFNTDGDLVVDLTEYDIKDLYYPVFEDGEYTFAAKNNTDSVYDITINKKGKIINKEKVG
ncbi:MAG: hypothetical protein IJT79_06705 [Ruminococcus sp.]|nr:hypothetical protein [Ruminococcus sp.]